MISVFWYNARCWTEGFICCWSIKNQFSAPEGRQTQRFGEQAPERPRPRGRSPSSREAPRGPPLSSAGTSAREREKRGRERRERRGKERERKEGNGGEGQGRAGAAAPPQPLRPRPRHEAGSQRPLAAAPLRPAARNLTGPSPAQRPKSPQLLTEPHTKPANRFVALYIQIIKKKKNLTCGSISFLHSAQTERS